MTVLPPRCVSVLSMFAQGIFLYYIKSIENFDENYFYIWFYTTLFDKHLSPTAPTSLYCYNKETSFNRGQAVVNTAKHMTAWPKK